MRFVVEAWAELGFHASHVPLWVWMAAPAGEPAARSKLILFALGLGEFKASRMAGLGSTYRFVMGNCPGTGGLTATLKLVLVRLGGDWPSLTVMVMMAAPMPDGA